MESVDAQLHPERLKVITQQVPEQLHIHSLAQLQHKHEPLDMDVTPACSPQVRRHATPSPCSPLCGRPAWLPTRVCPRVFTEQGGLGPALPVPSSPLHACACVCLQSRGAWVLLCQSRPEADVSRSRRLSALNPNPSDRLPALSEYLFGPPFL